MNFKDDRTGITHEGWHNSNPMEGRTLCGKNWLTFTTRFHWHGVRAEVDCMACIARRVSQENLLP